jgi:hypothetical protein
MERSRCAKYPAGNVWPAEMKANATAAYLDYETTGALTAAIKRGEAPPATATRIYNGRRIGVWSREACDAFIRRRHGLHLDTMLAANDNFNAAEFV